MVEFENVLLNPSRCDEHLLPLINQYHDQEISQQPSLIFTSEESASFRFTIKTRIFEGTCIRARKSPGRGVHKLSPLMGVDWSAALGEACAVHPLGKNPF